MLQLELSYTKSFLLFRASGTNPRHAQKGLFRHTSQGVCLLIPRSTGSQTPLPVRSKGSYLGAIMSYHNFEELTWHHRRKSGWTAFARLKVWLQTKQFPMNSRLYLWNTCIHSVLTYGLLAIQPTIKILQDYQHVVFRMLRIVIGDHAYLTHRTHQSALQHHGLPDPLTLLSQLASSLHHRLCQRCAQLHPDDVLLQLDWSHLTDTLHLIHEVQAASVQVAVDPDSAAILPQAVHACPCCAFVTYSLANLRRHLTTCHEKTQYRTFAHVT